MPSRASLPARAIGQPLGQVGQRQAHGGVADELLGGRDRIRAAGQIGEDGVGDRVVEPVGLADPVNQADRQGARGVEPLAGGEERPGVAGADGRST